MPHTDKRANCKTFTAFTKSPSPFPRVIHISRVFHTQYCESRSSSPNSPLTSSEQTRYSELTLFMGSFQRGLLSYNLVAFIKIHSLAASMNSFMFCILLAVPKLYVRFSRDFHFKDVYL